jgi:NTE family protein
MAVVCAGARAQEIGVGTPAEPAAITPAQAVPPARTRPRVALVLAGGGAKGAAHIGVLRVLEEARVPIDCVVGTSMGALVGAVYASGVAPEKVESAVRGVDWPRTVGGQGRRDRMPIRRKLAPITYSNSLEMGFGQNNFRMASGLIGTQEIEQVIRTLVGDARYTRNFDDLPIPFRAVATDMLSGEMAVLGSGDLSNAMRASMALPGAFSPVTLDGRLLSDGGMMRNLPVDVARELCGDVVIAVWMSSPPPKAAGLDTAIALVSRSMDVMIGANQQTQIRSLGARDVGIEVEMGDIGTTDFQRVPDAIELGRSAAQAKADQLAQYAVSEDEYRAWARSLGRDVAPDPVLADVRIVGTDRVNPDYVRTRIENALPGTSPSMAAIADDIERVYALGDFERVEYTLTGPEDARVLEIAPVEKSWGPNFFRFDIGVATYEGGDIFALLRMDHDRTWVNSLGGQWHNAVQIGRQSLFTTDFTQPLDLRQRFFVQPSALTREDYEDIYFDGDRVARYKLREGYGQVDLGVNLGTRAQLRVGVRHGEYEAKLDTGIPGLPELEKTRDGSLRLQAFYDTRDAVALPTRGVYLEARHIQSDDRLGGEQSYELFEAALLKAFSVRGDDSLALYAAFGDTLDGQLPITQQIEVGGIHSFPGLRPGELRGSEYWLVSTRYLWQLFDLQPLFGQALYAGVRVQATEMRERFDGVANEKLYGLSGSVGGRTPLGPFLLSLGYVDNGDWQLQFSMGRPIAEGSILDASE